MPLRSLGKKDVPKPFKMGSQTFMIPARKPVGVVPEKKPFAKGGHNAAYRAKYKGSRDVVLFRENFDKFDDDLEREQAQEISYNILFGELGIAPLMYAYGYAPSEKGATGYYWQVMEMYEESLHHLLQRRLPSLRVWDRVEKLTYDRFAQLAKFGVFCYDIHPRNVVLRGVKSGRPIDVKLIDFDHTFCVAKQRMTRPGKKNACYKGKNGQCMKNYKLSGNNHLLALLLVFSTNTGKRNGRRFFRTQIRSMLKGEKKYLMKGGGKLDLNVVLHFLKVSKAQGTYGTLEIMQHWGGDDRGTARKFVEKVIGQRLPAGKIPMPFLFA